MTTLHEFVPRPSGGEPFDPTCAVCDVGPGMHVPAALEVGDLEMVDVIGCPECGGYYTVDGGPDNLALHMREDHPDSLLARTVALASTGVTSAGKMPTRPTEVVG